MAGRVAVSRTYTAPVSENPARTDANSSTTAAESAARSDAAAATPPAPVRQAVVAIGVQIVCGLAAALASWAFVSEYRVSLLRSNKDAKTPKTLCSVSKVKGCLDPDRTVHAFLVQSTIAAVVFVIALALLTRGILRGSRQSRMLYIIVSVVGAFLGFAASPLALLSLLSSGPAVIRVLSTIGALASIAAIVLLFRPAAARYIEAHSPRPAPGTRPKNSSLRSILAPRPMTDGGSTSGVSMTKEAADADAPARAAKAKRRTDAESVARGAELARARAKASKSRRTEQ